HIDSIKTAKAPVILTPHPGEMARLLRITTAQVQANRYASAQQFAVDFQAVVVLKGANTLVALPDGRVFVNRTGNPGMARGGSGDVLAGMIGAFLAQGIAPEKAAMCGVYLHGLAGDRSAAKLSQMGMLPTDMIQELPALFLEFGR
ncbi:MAG: NAD(P)H-hydrate dehydratase, partial [Clostridium sp.]